ncbi:enoyl-CoA hydratase-related protein [Caldibacillus thermolactis]|jgi:2-(1,2-epoxy-1,2-dihydrophenyl)acetyl-CoA isomerase|uniref:Enoyl-CoA hydratase-related protein n=1 Tax=Pallidibacillus thermolactis TaxID=251051 RepID=A0ABT2WFJ5_9BACI|nr:enoyl-CoA hydratase-related protein [Pallidibacillus thermolactis]MCU9594433.1 enoyl-CoA hydratase-related protein [Pallidibacillus thermolactis]MCU9601200.1 enoyl-CoA hydratase-related protein [Pallidibacillus thermolactis subsp. kokeshiiformis]MED1672370.1 enoyl-CoA hydratase-related protein [Pallidibacillus thermolactis subsp. kokeshiiformis]
MNYQSIKVAKREDGVAIVKFNRPEVRNALGLEMRQDLIDFFSTAKHDPDIKSIILTGEGKVFSAGGDLSTMKDIDAVSGRERLQYGHELIRSIVNIEKPVIAAINGAAAGAGISIALACDMIVACQSTVFIQSFVKVGLVPDLGAIYFLPRLIGRHRALEFMFLGEKVTAEQAHELGIVNKVVDDHLLMEEAEILATRLAEAPNLAIGLMKKLVNRSVLAELDETLELEGFAQGLLFESDNFKEGVQAFFEKRKPIFNK